MDNLTFGEQVKVILGRKGMTIKALAEAYEAHTGENMSRQNLTQRLGRDNFQEQDMRLIAEILGCPFHLNILPVEEVKESSSPIVNKGEATKKPGNKVEKVDQKLVVAGSKPTKAKEKATSQEAGEDMTIGDIYDIHQGLSELEANLESGKEVEVSREEVEKTLTKKEEIKAVVKASGNEDKVSDKPKARVAAKGLGEDDFEPVVKRDDKEEDRELGEINPYTGREYQSNSVRMHPNRIGYVQVYDRSIHKWTDMTEWAFLGYQERMKNLLGQNYEPPIYLD